MEHASPTGGCLRLWLLGSRRPTRAMCTEAPTSDAWRRNNHDSKLSELGKLFYYLKQLSYFSYMLDRVTLRKRLVSDFCKLA